MTQTRLATKDIDFPLLEFYAASSHVACDIETTGLDWDSDRIGTCQLHSPEAGTTVIQIGQNRPDNLCKLLENENVVKIFHHAPFDLRFMINKWSLTPTSIECTKVASKMLKPDARQDRHSLQYLLRDELGVNIDKTERMSDWTTSNLTEAQVAYASSDVLHLIPLARTLKTKLNNAGLLEIYKKCCSFLPLHAEIKIRRWPDLFSY
ncbi:ribonuclease D [Saccharopolyspora spinosa]|uniref:Ribonuclease D n=1 Tax=Saccharopolyspora spinosa TaxID=60894 RepID=A0A2N3XUH4_SACSN|nr:3'-5' exonuclease [Saccharopolyspora spinosa]PKW14271.1 ribonuclease D [Saccharopolyspora spinosa]